MRALSREPRKYVISTEWERLHPSSKSLPTIWHIKIQTGEDMLRWGAHKDFANEDQRLMPEEKAQRLVELDNDFLVAAIVRVENWEQADGTICELTDAKSIRDAVKAIGRGERTELARACWNEGSLDLGEPERLRSQLTSSSGEEKSQTVSANTDATTASQTGSGKDAPV